MKKNIINLSVFLFFSGASAMESQSQLSASENEAADALRSFSKPADGLSELYDVASTEIFSKSAHKKKTKKKFESILRVYMCNAPLGNSELCRQWNYNRMVTWKHRKCAHSSGIVKYCSYIYCPFTTDNTTELCVHRSTHEHQHKQMMNHKPDSEIVEATSVRFRS